jgi:hypothetical protein
MSQLRLGGALAVTVALVLFAPSGAIASPHFHECQKPVRTGVEIYKLRGISPATACPVALALFAWEASSPARSRALYGCSRPKPEAAGYPYLRLHRFRGYRISLTGKFKEFTMSRGGSSFEVSGTDFPLNCT